MSKLVQNQIGENQMIERELEELSGGGNCGSGNDCGFHLADEDDQDNVVF